MADLIYEVSFKGVASPTLRGAFADFDLGTGSGCTRVRCPHDALGDVVARVEELGLEIVEVRLIAEHPAAPRRGASDEAEMPSGADGVGA